MGPYSHFILASKLAPYLQPQDAGEYYWGAIIPDIRYLARMRRKDTHLAQERLQELAACYPHLGAFLLGYQVHCLIDEIEVAQVVSAAFPLNILKRVLRKDFSQPQMAMLIEMYYLQKTAAGAALSGSHNEVLSGLGITPQQTGQFFQAMQGYIQSHSFDAVISAFQKIGMIENTRLEAYLKAYDTLKRSKLVMAIFRAGVKNARLDAYAMNYVRSRLQVL